MGGMGAFIAGLNSRDETVVIDHDTGKLKAQKTGWNSLMTIGVASFGFGIVLVVH